MAPRQLADRFGSSAGTASRPREVFDSRSSERNSVNMPSGQVRRRSPIQGEFALIDKLRRRFASEEAKLIRGIGEDAAVIRVSPREWMLMTTDLLAEGVHFDLAASTLEDVGYRAAIANLSDIASMGGRPQYLLVAIAIPPTLTSAQIQRVYEGLMQACRPFGVHLVGGDTSASHQGLFISLTLTGVVESGRALRRDGARVGDLLYVTGTLGDSRAGLLILKQATRKPNSPGARARMPAGGRFLLRRHHRPSARIDEGRWLTINRLATAVIDVSDGLAGDVRHLCDQSGVGVELEPQRLPISRPCEAFARSRGLDPVELALAGGEDYELLCAVRRAHQARFERGAEKQGYQFTRIGTVKPASYGLRIRGTDGSLRPLTVHSYEHFRTTSSTM